MLIQKKNLLITLLLALTGLLTSCEEPVRTPEPLDRPVLRVTNQTETSFALEWAPIEGAGSYSYYCDWTPGEEKITLNTRLSFSDLEPGATYTLEVWALPADPSVSAASQRTQLAVTLTGGEISQEDMFEIEIYQNSTEMLYRVVITPKDPTMTYYREAFEDVWFNDLGGTIESAWYNGMMTYIDTYGSEFFWSQVAWSGVDDFEISYRYDQRTYITVAGIDEGLNRTTKITSEVLYTGPVPESDLTFDVAYENVTTSGALVKVTPSDNTTQYSMLMIPSRQLQGYSSEEIEDLVRYSYQSYIEDGHLYTGYLEMNYRDGSLQANTEYTILLFGWNTIPCTEIYTYTLKTQAAASSADLTFEWELEILSPTEIYAKITPSDMTAEYIVVPMPDYDYEEFGDDIYAYLDYILLGMLTPYEYASMFATTGITEKTFNEADDGIYPNNSYMFFAVGVDLDHSNESVIFYDPQWYGEMVTTPSDRE